MPENYRTCYKIGCTQLNTCPSSWFCLPHQEEDREHELNERGQRHLQSMAAAEYERTGSCTPLNECPSRLITARSRAMREMGMQ